MSAAGFLVRPPPSPGQRLEGGEVESGAERLPLATGRPPARPAPPSAAHPLAASAVNIAPSSALRLSGRLSRTSATPWSSMEMVTRSLMHPIVACHLGRMKLNLTADGLSDHHPLGPQAPRLRPAGRAGDRRGVPRDRPPGADRFQPPGLALGGVEDRRRSRRSPTSTAPTSTSTATCPAPCTRRATRAPNGWTVRDSAGYLSDNFHRVPLMMIPCMWGGSTRQS